MAMDMNSMGGGSGNAKMACPMGLDSAAGCPICGGDPSKCIGQMKQGTNGMEASMPPSDMRNKPPYTG